MVMDTVGVCVAKGWVEWAGKRAGWRLTSEGQVVLSMAAELVARDGEPAGNWSNDFTTKPAPPTPEAVREEARRLSSPSPEPVTVLGQFYDHSEYARNEDPT